LSNILTLLIDIVVTEFLLML